MTNDDWTEEIRDRLVISTPLPPENYKNSWSRGTLEKEAQNEFITHARIDIANLLKEREVLREAVKAAVSVADMMQWHDNISIYRKALAWKPEK